MHSRVAQSLMGALLLLQLASAATAAAGSAQDPIRVVINVKDAVDVASQVAPRPFPRPPAPDPQQRDLTAVFRYKDRTPCACENGGRCNRRVRRCECPLGFTGPHCEVVDRELFAHYEAVEAAKRAQQEQQQVQQEAERLRVRVAPSEWLFYVALVAALALLVAMLRVFADLIASYCEEGSEKQKKSLKQPLPAAYENKGCSIYTLPFPVQPPPYSEKAAAAAFAHSTPCCKLQPMQQQQQQLPDFV